MDKLIPPAPGQQVDILNQWDKLGLEPIEVATEDLSQRIIITHDALTGQIKWETEKMDGVQAEGIMVRTLFSMYKYFFASQPRPPLTSGKANVAVKLDGNRLAVGLEPLHDPSVIAGVLAVALCEVLERVEGDDPMKKWVALFEVDLDLK